MERWIFLGSHGYIGDYILDVTNGHWQSFEMTRHSMVACILPSFRYLLIFVR